MEELDECDEMNRCEKNNEFVLSTRKISFESREKEAKKDLERKWYQMSVASCWKTTFVSNQLAMNPHLFVMRSTDAFVLLVWLYVRI